MASLNQVTLLGNLAADPEVRTLSSGEKVASFTLAVNEPSREGKAGRASFIPCEVWGGWAENLAKTGQKGSAVLVEGKLVQDHWTDKDTEEKRTRLKVRARAVFHVEVQFAR